MIDNMDFFELIEKRESVRDFVVDVKVEMDILLKIVNAGRLAPSASNRQPWRFLIVSSEKKLEELKECYHRDWFKKAPHILVVVGDKNSSWVRKKDGYNSIETDLTIAMDHIILAAEAIGVGACWISAFDNEVVRDVLQLADNEVVFNLTPLGYQSDGYAKKGKKDRKPLDEVVVLL